MGERRYYIYIMASRSRVLYVGMTNNLVPKAFGIREHKRKEVDSFTARYNVARLVWYRAFPRPQGAIAAEKTIKGWLREKKEALVEDENPSWTDLGPKVMAEDA